LATTSKKMSHQILGLRGYLRYVRGHKRFSSDQKVTKVEALRSHIKRPDEMYQAIALLGDAPCTRALALVTTLAEDPAVVEEAYSAMVQIAGQTVPGLSKEQRRAVLDRVLKESKNEGTKQRARRAIRKLR
jgi:hypothetical protein